MKKGNEIDLGPISIIAQRILNLIEHGESRSVEGIFYICFKYYSWRAYAIKHRAGPPTIRVDIRERT